MAIYIELDKVIEQFCSCGSVFTYGDNVCKAIVSRLKQVPTADVVPVVRCKDCVHHIDAPQTTDVWCERIDGLLQRNWFCADGERRDDEESTKREEN